VTLIFPNYWDRNNYVGAREVVRVPGPNFRSELYATPPAGQDTIMAIVSSRRWQELEIGRPDAATVMAAWHCFCSSIDCCAGSFSKTSGKCAPEKHNMLSVKRRFPF